MKMKYSVLVLSFMLLWLILGVNACSDNSTSSSKKSCNSINFPSQLVQAQVTIEYFNSQNIPNDEEHSNYNLVQQYAVAGSSSLLGGLAIAEGYLTLARGFSGDPKSDNGACVWSFDASAFTEGESLIVKVTANTVSDGIQWEVNVDGDFEGENVDNFRYIEGFVSTDKKTGEWSLYSPENPNTPAFSYTWDIESDDIFELSYESPDSSLDYSRNGSENNNMEYDTDGAIINLFWNEETDDGWIELSGGDRMCYTNFVNSACS